MPSGPLPSNPAELLGSQRMVELIAMLMWVTYLLMGFVWHNQFTDAEE